MITNMNFKISEDLKMIREFYEMTQEELAEELKIEKLRIARCESGLSYPRFDFLDLIYGYCFGRGLNLNRQKEMLYKDDLVGDHILLTHASKDGLTGKIDLNVGKTNNDFGKGFYCGSSYDRAVSFIAKSKNACVYFFDFNPKGLKRIQFGVDEDWMLAIAYYRGRLDAYRNNPKIQNIISKIKECDYIIAPIADNRMFEIIDSYIEGFLTNEQCMHCLAATNLGYQYVFLTDRAIDQLKPLERCFVSTNEKEYYLQEQIKYQKEGQNKSKLAKIEYKGKGKYIEEVLS